MSRNQILVRNIKHLTDARYFAAMGVDWMSMELNSDPTSFMRWHTLRDWVEGVKLAAEIDAGDEMLLSKTIIDARPDGIILKMCIRDSLLSVWLFTIPTSDKMTGYMWVLILDFLCLIRSPA